MYGENLFTLFMEIVVVIRIKSLVGSGTVDWRTVYKRCLKHYLYGYQAVVLRIFFTFSLLNTLDILKR